MGTTSAERVPRIATVDDADEIGRLLHDFNAELETSTPGVAVLAARLRSILATADTFAILAGVPAVGVALVTVRTNVWFDGPVSLLDELYVAPDHRSEGIGSAIIALVMSTSLERGVDLIEINVDEGDVDAQRFYARHGFTSTEPDSDERAVYFFRDLSS